MRGKRIIGGAVATVGALALVVLSKTAASPLCAIWDDSDPMWWVLLCYLGAR